MKLIVALDVEHQSTALSLIDQLDPALCALKVGHEMFTHFGAVFVRALVERHFNVFLDLKFHDIPNTVAHACTAAAELGVWMMNVHALGGLAMMKAARHALDAYGVNRPLLIAVTVLTSLNADDLRSVGITLPVGDHATLLARLAQEAGLDGVVSSALEVPVIKAACGEHFLAVTPGIRMPDDDRHDHLRLVTPQAAIALGSDYLVVGRPITTAVDPARRVRDIMQAVS